MRRPRIWLAVWGLALVASLGHAGAAWAADAGQPSLPPPGVAITPAIQDRVLGPSDKSVSFSVQLTNQTDKPLTFSLSSNDFTSLNQAGGLAFIGSDASNVSSGHGLSAVLKFDKPIVTLAANSNQVVTARVGDVSKLASGGHYAAILAQALPSDSSDANTKVNINQVVSSLIFLQTAGQGTRTLQLLQPPSRGLVFSLPASANLVFKATGNTQTTPRGVATIDHRTQEIGRGVINKNSSLLLPGSTRLFQIPISGNKHPLWPGKYTFRVQYRYEGSLGITTYQKSFVYVNVPAVLLAIVILVAVGFGGFKIWRLRKKANRQADPAPVDEADKQSITISDKSHKFSIIKVIRRVKKP